MSVIRRDDGPTEREEAAIREGMAFAQAAEDAREARDEARADLVIARQRLAGAVDALREIAYPPEFIASRSRAATIARAALAKLDAGGQ